MRKAISRCVVCSKHHEHQPLRSNLCAEANQSNAARADATSSAHPSRSTTWHGNGRKSRPLLVHSRAPLLDHFIAQRTQHVVDVGLASARVPSPRSRLSRAWAEWQAQAGVRQCGKSAGGRSGPCHASARTVGEWPGTADRAAAWKAALVSQPHRGSSTRRPNRIGMGTAHVARIVLYPPHLWQR